MMKNKYWFIFCSDSLLLERHPDGTYSIPQAAESPVQIQEWTHVLNIAPFDDGAEVKACYIDQPITNPDGRYEMCGLRKSYYKLPMEFYLKAGKCHEPALLGQEHPLLRLLRCSHGHAHRYL